VPVMSTEAALAPVSSPAGVGRETLAAAPSLDAPTLSAGQVPGIPESDLSIITSAPPPAAPKASAPVPVHSLLRRPVRVHYVVPGYPDMARMAKVQGTVIIEAVIGPTGDVVDARVLRSIALLDAEALAAVRQWKYTPSLLNGVPVPVVMTVTVTFTLQ
jgi:periplasmic protein TonB